MDERSVMKLLPRGKGRLKAFESAITWGNSRVIFWWFPRIEVIGKEEKWKG